MAKFKEDREDLMRDGTAMAYRGRLLIDGVEVVIGFRSGGQASVYWGQDPVFQFNSLHQLRRLFLDGVRLAAENGRLVKLKQDDETMSPRVAAIRLEREPISSELLCEIEARWQSCHRELTQRVILPWDDSGTVVGESPESFRERLRIFCDSTSQALRIAGHPGLIA
jgi:hypothetical protein